MIKKIFLIIFQLFGFLYSQNIYLSPAGSDLNPGTAKEPVLSLEKAFLLARKHSNVPVKINISSGKYFMQNILNIDINDHRTAKNQITVVGDSKNIPVFYGAHKLCPKLDVNNGLWILDISKISDKSKLRQFLTINDKFVKSSQYPKSGFTNPLGVKYTQNQEAIITINDELDSILKKCTFQQLKHIWVTVYVSWGTIIRYIDEYNPSKKTIKINAPYGFAPYDIKTTTNLTLNNLPNIHSKGEWYYKDENTILYNPLLTDKIENSEIFISAIDKFIDIVGSEKKRVANISFQNIMFSAAGESLTASGYDPDQAAMKVGAVITLNHVENINFKNVFFNKISSNAIWFQKGCSNSSVINSIFDNLGAGGVKIGIMDDLPSQNITNSIIVDNNILKTGGLIYPGAVPIIIFKAYNNKITHNDISDFSYTAISLGWVWGYQPSPSKNNLIAFNHIYNIGKGILDDLGGIYTLGKSEKTIIKNNLIHDIKSNNYGGWGIYADAGSSNILIDSNLIFNCSSAGFHQNYGENNIIKNNIFAYNDKVELESTIIENHNAFIFTNNIIVHKNYNFFSPNWFRTTQKSYNNIYYSLSDEEINKKELETGSFYINPNLQKKNFYYEVTDKDAMKKINFKQIDFSEIGIVNK